LQHSGWIFLTALAGIAAQPLSAATAPTANTQQPAASTDFWMSMPAIQGGLVIARAPRGAVSVTLNGVALPLTADGFFLMGFDRDAESSAILTATFADGRMLDRTLAVTPGNWRIEHVSANPTGGAKTTAEFEARRGAELDRINAARAKTTPGNGWRQAFMRPVAGRLAYLARSVSITGYPAAIIAAWTLPHQMEHILSRRRTALLRLRPRMPSRWKGIC
jgi:hypothetical protein